MDEKYNEPEEPIDYTPPRTYRIGKAHMIAAAVFFGAIYLTSSYLLDGFTNRLGKRIDDTGKHLAQKIEGAGDRLARRIDDITDRLDRDIKNISKEKEQSRQDLSDELSKKSLDK